MYDSTFQDCIMAAFQVPFLDIVKSQTVQQNNFLNDSSMQKIIILSAGFYFCAFWNSIKVSAGSDIEFWHVYSPRLKYADILPKLNAFTFFIQQFLKKFNLRFKIEHESAHTFNFEPFSPSPCPLSPILPNPNGEGEGSIRMLQFLFGKIENKFLLKMLCYKNFHLCNHCIVLLTDCEIVQLLWVIGFNPNLIGFA